MATKLTPENDMNDCGCKSSEIGVNHNVLECLAAQQKPIELRDDKDSDAKAGEK